MNGRPLTPLRDPPVTDLCATCRQPRRPEKANTRAVRQLAELDAFCSSPCARAFFNCSLPEVSHAHHRKSYVGKGGNTA